MGFLNEFISEEDVEKYDIANIDKKFMHGGTRSRDWTIDRDRNIYLRRVSNGREEFASFTRWTLYYKQTLIVVKLQDLGMEGHRGETIKAHSKVVYIRLPDELENDREEIVKVLGEALLVYGDGGVFRTAKTFELKLEI